MIPVKYTGPVFQHKRMERLAGAMLAMNDGDPNLDAAPVTHHFSHGVYAREMRIPAGATVVGAIHRHESLMFMLAGEASVVLDDGPQIMKAPQTIVSPAGVQRAVHAITDCIFTVVHGTWERDVDKIEKQFIARSYQEYLQAPKKELA